MQKVILIEDNPVILEVMSRALSKENIQTTKCNSAEVGIRLLQQEDFDLVITDLHMGNLSGLDVIDFVRNTKKSKVPIMVITSDKEDVTVIKALRMGADDYTTKPLSVGHLLIRTKKLLGLEPTLNTVHDNYQSAINNENVAVIIPCYNEAERLNTTEFASFLTQNTNYTLCFVNDGSKDNTLEVLENFKSCNPQYIEVLNLEKNSGKAEAVRQGMLYMHSKGQFDHIGFLDADLSTDFRDMQDMISELTDSDYKAVVGSRISRVGAEIHKNDARAVISIGMKRMINSLTKMSFQDTQCGAKLFRAELIGPLFQQRFRSSWLFDVEIFIRMRKLYGKQDAQKLICEYPLRRWVHVDGSKLGMKDALKIFGELYRIKKNYQEKHWKTEAWVKSFSSTNWNNYHKSLSQT